MKLVTLIFFISSLGLAESANEYHQENNPKLCQKFREQAMRNCRADRSCYTHELSRLVDRYNSELRWDDQVEDLFCHY